MTYKIRANLTGIDSPYYINVAVFHLPKPQSNLIEDLKTSIFNFYYLDFNKRDVILAYAKWIGSDYEKNG